MVKGGAKAPSSYSHSSGIWMNRQGLQRRRGHKYRSATAIFQAAPAARHSRRTRLRLARPGGKRASGRLGAGTGGGGTGRGEDGRKGGGGEKRKRMVVSYKHLGEPGLLAPPLAPPAAGRLPPSLPPPPPNFEETKHWLGLQVAFHSLLLRPLPRSY